MKQIGKNIRKFLTVSGLIALIAASGCSHNTATVPALVQIMPPASTTVQAGSSTFVMASAVPIGVTWSLSGSGCSGAACGTLNGATQTSVNYVAPVSFSGSGLNVTLTATSKVASSISASITLTVLPVSVNITGPPENTLLNGSYAFYGLGWQDASNTAATNRIAYIGSFTADGKGNVTAGELDVNSPTGLVSYSSVTGAYNLSSDQTGLLVLLPSGAQIGSIITMAISVGGLNNGVASTGALITYEDSTGIGATGSSNGVRITGPIALQSASVLGTTATPLSGSFAFGLSGGASAASANTTCTTIGCPISLAGAITLGSSGAITKGVEDLTIASTSTSSVALSGQVANNGNTDASGRVAAMISAANTTLPSWPADYIVYMVSPQTFYIMSSDSFATNSLIAGVAQQQKLADIASSPFSASEAMVMYGNLYSSQNLPASKGEVRSELQLLTLKPTSATAGTLSGTEILNASGTYSTPTTIGSSAYTVASNGRVTLAGTADPAYMYLVDTNTGFATANGGGGPTAGIFYFVPQTSTSLSAGTYFFAVGPALASSTGPVETGSLTLPAGGVASTASNIAVTGEAYASFSEISADEGNSAGTLLFNEPLTGTLSNASGILTPVLSTGIQGCASGEGFVISLTSFACLTGVKSGGSYAGYAQVHIFQQ